MCDRYDDHVGDALENKSLCSLNLVHLEDLIVLTFRM